MISSIIVFRFVLQISFGIKLCKKKYIYLFNELFYKSYEKKKKNTKIQKTTETKIVIEFFWKNLRN